MKRLLLSLCFRFVVVVGYLLVAGLIVYFLSEDKNNLDPSLVYLVDLPMRLPKYVYFYLFPPTADMYATNPGDISSQRLIAGVAIFLANVLLYTIPVYLLYGVIARFWTRRRQAKPILASQPPPPPQF